MLVPKQARTHGAADLRKSVRTCVLGSSADLGFGALRHAGRSINRALGSLALMNARRPPSVHMARLLHLRFSAASYVVPIERLGAPRQIGITTRYIVMAER